MGIERTDDGGQTWYGDHVDSNKPDKDRHGPVGGLDNQTYVLEWDPKEEELIYAATANGLFRTQDDGVSWERKSIPGVTFPPAYRGWTLAVHPERRGHLTAGIGHTVARSGDRGDTWTTSDLADAFPSVNDLHIRGVTYADPAADEVILAVEQDGLYRLEDGEFTELTGDLPNLVYPRWDLPLSFSADRVSCYFIAGRSEQMYPIEEWWEDRALYAYDTNTNEVRTINTPVKPNAVVTHPADSSTLMIGGDKWVHESRDGGETWHNYPDGFIDRYLATVGVNTSSPGTVIAGSLCSTGLSVSHDRGRTFDWKRSGLAPWHQGPFNEHYVMQIRAFERRIYATTAAGLLISEDNGDSWRLLKNEFSGKGDFQGELTHLHGLDVHPSDPDTVYVGTGMGGPGNDAFAGESFIWKSEDGGTTWEERTNGFPNDRETCIQDIVVSEHDPAVVFIGTNKEDYIEQPPTATGHGLFRSENGGQAWNDLSTPFENVHAIVEDPYSAERLFVSTPRGVFRSDDSGQTWENVLKSPTKALLAHPTEPNVIFAGSQTAPEQWDVHVANRYSVLVSTDGGNSWAHGNLEIGVGKVPTRQEYDGIERHSHYWGENGEINWFAFDERTGSLYAATRGTGLWRVDLRTTDF